MANTLVLIIICHVWLNWIPIEASLKFGNLQCTSDQAETISLEECHIKAINRNKNTMNIRYVLKKMLSEFQLHFQLFKRERGGWHPFLYRMTFDLCEFLQKPGKFLVPNEIFKRFKGYTTLNHTCPYLANSEIKLVSFFLDEVAFMKTFPVDYGEYAMHTIWYHKKKPLMRINGSVIYLE